MMELTKDIPAEKLPPMEDEVNYNESCRAEIPSRELRDMSETELLERVEQILLARLEHGSDQATYQLGQMYFEQEKFDQAKEYYQLAVKKPDFQAMFQLAVIYYDGLAGHVEYAKAISYMKRVSNLKAKRFKPLVCAAQFNLGRAYFQGFGVTQSDSLAERYWLTAADDGSPSGSVKAQTILGMFYTRKDSLDLRKAAFWHSEACGNGSLESQGAVGVMYMYGLGKKKNNEAAFLALRGASDRGNIYAMGHLVSFYYRRRMYTKTTETAAKVAFQEDVMGIAKKTDCMPLFVAKGIALGCFYYGRCLQLGIGGPIDHEEAQRFFTKSYHFDAEMCAKLQQMAKMDEL